MIFLAKNNLGLQPLEECMNRNKTENNRKLFKIHIEQ